MTFNKELSHICNLIIELLDSKKSSIKYDEYGIVPLTSNFIIMIYHFDVLPTKL
jgi:hypothetical protein